MNVKSEQDVFETAKAFIRSGEKTLVVVKNNVITHSGTPRGIQHILELYEEGILSDAYVADKVIGKSAAMIYTLAGVHTCYAHIVSMAALKWLNCHHIQVIYEIIVPSIQNRSGEGMCPMELTVLNCHDVTEAHILLKNKLLELNK